MRRADFGTYFRRTSTMLDATDDVRPRTELARGISKEVHKLR
jgi:hypothetical protein